MNEERTGKCLRQVEHIRGHLWHRYSITVISQLNQKEVSINLVRSHYIHYLFCVRYLNIKSDVDYLIYSVIAKNSESAQNSQNMQRQMVYFHSHSLNFLWLISSCVRFKLCVLFIASCIRFKLCVLFKQMSPVPDL
jgi:hypothetical protein